MDKLDIEGCRDMVWGSDPYFPRVDGLTEKQWMQPPVVVPPKPKFDQRAYRDGNGLVRFYPSRKFVGFGNWEEDTGVEEEWGAHTRLSDEEAERIWNTRPEAKKGNQFAFESALKYDDDGSGLFIGAFGEEKERPMSAPKRPTKPATVPYSGGSKPEPKLEWRVELDGTDWQIKLMVDGKMWKFARIEDPKAWSKCNSRHFKKLNKQIEKCKRALLTDYNLCKKESGRVEQ